jgi:enoyl-[acyl-carrier protein] reductase I
MGFLADKKILITGLLSKHSIAYGIAKACHREGAQLAFTYQTERFEDRIKKFAAEFGSDITIPVDVSSDEQIENLFVELASAGTAWMGWCIPLPTPRPKPSKATS